MAFLDDWEEYGLSYKNQGILHGEMGVNYRVIGYSEFTIAATSIGATVGLLFLSANYPTLPLAASLTAYGSYYAYKGYNHIIEGNHHTKISNEMIKEGEKILASVKHSRENPIEILGSIKELPANTK